MTPPDPMSASAIALVLGYLLGSVPFGLLLTRAAGLGDIRAIGSGNIGATNVLRTGNKKLAAITLLLDVLKGALPVLIAAYWIGAPGAIAAGIGAFLGHCFPVWLGFKGGKGVATYIGVLVGWLWPAAVAFCVIWLLTAFATRYSSLSALLAAALTPLFILGYGASPPMIGAATLLTAILIWKHRANVGRLVQGTESKIGEKG